MNDAVRGGANIAAVERETGLGKDTLRVWERRYGFPQPLRDENGDRLYPTDQVSRLRLIKRLMDRGHRPGRLVQASDEVLQELSLEASHSLPGNLALTSAKPLGKEQEAHSEFFNLVFERILQHDLVGLRVLLSQCLAKEGLKRFVMDIVPRLNARVGEGWENGSVQDCGYILKKRRKLRN